jgi:hypothetical protein
MKPRLVESVLGEDPPIMVKYQEGTDEEKQQKVEAFMNWRITSNADVEEKVVESAHQFLTPGITIAKVKWDINERRAQYLRKFAPETPFEEIISEVLGQDVPFGKPEQLDKGEMPKWRIPVRTPRNRERDVIITLHALPSEQQVLIDRTETLWERSDVTLLDPEDFIAPVKGGGDVQRLPWCMQRLWYDENTLRKKVAQGRFYKDAVERLIAGDTPEGDNAQIDASEVRSIRAQVEGTEEFGETSVRSGEYAILECYYRYDLDEDGLDEEIMFWVCPERGDLLLGWDFLDNVFATGMRPFILGKYFPLPGRLYGLSFPRIVRPIQEEINTIHNQRVDNGTIRNTVSGFYPSSWTVNPQDVEVSPGGMRPVEDPRMLVFPNWNGSDAWGQNEEALLMQMFERLTGINDLSLGRQPNRVGATRTATGVASLLSEAGLRFKNAMRAFQRFWRDIFAAMLALEQQYLPPGIEFRVTGRWPEVISFTSKADIAGKFDVQIVATSETLNRQLLREDATIKLQFASNPILLQTGRIGLKGLDFAARRYLRAYGETDPSMILEPLRQEIVRAPAEEEAMWINGDYSAEPSMAEDQNQHIQSHQRLLMDPVARQVLGPEGVKAAEQHLAKTTQMAQMQAVVAQMGQKGPGAGQNPQAGTQPQNAQRGRMEGMMGGGGQGMPAGMGGGTMGPVAGNANG